MRTLAEIQKLLPAQYHDYLPLFEGDIGAELLPHRPGIDHTFTLEKDENRREKKPPWGFLDGINRDKWLVLQKTLNELLDKRFIYASSFPVGALVLFVKKKRGLWFYVIIITWTILPKRTIISYLWSRKP